MSRTVSELMNNAYQLAVTTIDNEVYVRLRDLAMDFDLADGAYIYRASSPCDEGSVVAKQLNNPIVEVSGEVMKITGTFLGLRVEHILRLPVGRAVMEERIILAVHEVTAERSEHNPTDSVVALENFAVGMQRRIANEVGSIFPELSSDRLVAIPFRP